MCPGAHSYLFDISLRVHLNMFTYSIIPTHLVAPVMFIHILISFLEGVLVEVGKVLTPIVFARYIVLILL